MHLNKKILIPILAHLACPFKFEFLFSKISPNKNLIIMYHGVTLNNYKHINTRHTTIKNIEIQLAYFKKHFRIVSLDEIFTAHRNNTNPSLPTIAITFDDGYENNYFHVLPILNKFKIPATFFVSTICLMENSHILWPDLIDLFIYFNNYNSIKLEERVFVKKDRCFSSNGTELRDFIKSLDYRHQIEIFQLIKKYISYEKIKTLINSEFFMLLNKEQIKKVAQFPLVEIGSHGHQHLDLENIPFEEAKSELEISKSLLEKTIEKEVISIAFPDGSYNEKIKKKAQEAGYKNLLAVDYRCVEDKKDKRILPRFNINNRLNNESIFFMLHYYFNKRGF